jgi:hypothetical protein
MLELVAVSTGIKSRRGKMMVAESQSFAARSILASSKLYGCEHGRFGGQAHCPKYS